MKINSIIALDEKALRKDISRTGFSDKLWQTMKTKAAIALEDLDPKRIEKSEYFIHDFFFIESSGSKNLFVVYKVQHYRVLLYVDFSNNNLVEVAIFLKSRNHQPYYKQFRQTAKALVRSNALAAID